LGYSGSGFARSRGHFAEKLWSNSGAKGGFDAARGEVIIAMDGDLQHDPAEIPSFIEKLDEGFDIVAVGARKGKTLGLPAACRAVLRIGPWLNFLESHCMTLALLLRRTGREIIKTSLFMESYIVHSRLAAWSGARITEIPVTNLPRQHGKSNYGISRTFRVFLDLLSTKFLAGLLDKANALLWLFRPHCDRGRHNDRVPAAFQKAIARTVFTSNATLTFGDDRSAFGWSSIMCVGLTSEMLSRTYYESQKKPIYVSRATTISEADLEFRPEVAGRVEEEDSGNPSKNHANPSNCRRNPAGSARC